MSKVEAGQHEYGAVRAWCEFMHSAPYYTEQQVQDAVHERAPHLAVYKQRGQWVTLDQLTAPGVRHYFRSNYPDLATHAWGEEK